MKLKKKKKIRPNEGNIFYCLILLVQETYCQCRFIMGIIYSTYSDANFVLLILRFFHSCNCLLLVFSYTSLYHKYLFCIFNIRHSPFGRRAIEFGWQNSMQTKIDIIYPKENSLRSSWLFYTFRLEIRPFLKRLALFNCSIHEIVVWKFWQFWIS